MKKLIALALSSAIIALPASANAEGRHHDRNWDGHNYAYSYRHHDGGFRYRNYGYRNYGYAYPRTRTVISIGYPGYG